MSAPKQWDISKAVVIASFFNFFHNVANFCVFPFLTIFFRHLGLSPPLVGIIVGSQHLVVALWAPFCTLAAKTDHKRRMVITSSLILSAMAGAVFTVFPTLPQDAVFRFCNASLPGTDGRTTPSAVDFEMFAPEDNDTFTLLKPPLMTTLASTQALVESSTLESLRNVETTTKFDPTRLVDTTHPGASITLQKITKLKDRTTTNEWSLVNLDSRTSSLDAPLVDLNALSSPPQADLSKRLEPKEKPPVDPNRSTISSPPQAEPSKLLEPKEKKPPVDPKRSTISSPPPEEAISLLEPKKSKSPFDHDGSDEGSPPQAEPSNISEPKENKAPLDHEGFDEGSPPQAEASNISEPKENKAPLDHDGFDEGSPPQAEPNERESPKSSLSSSPPAEPFSHYEPKKRDLLKIPSQTSYFLDVEIKTFVVVLGIVLLWEFFASPLEWTADDSLHEYLDFVDATDRHESVWIWRYLGACLGSCFIVVLIDGMKCYIIPQIPKIYLHFYGYTTFMVVTLLLSILYPVYVSKNTEHASKTVKALSLMGSDGRVILLFVTLFLMGAVRSTTQNFLFWQMQDIGSSEFYMGLSVAVALFSEIVLYLFKNRLMKSLTFKWMVVLALLCQSAQFLYYSFLWAPWAVLPIQLLSAFSHGVLIWAVRSQVDDIANPGTERSIQLVLNCFSHHCGASLGSFASGFVIGSFGLPILYWACSVLLLVWILMFLIIQPKMPHSKKINYSRLLAPDNSDSSDSEDEQEQDWLVKAMKDDRKIW